MESVDLAPTGVLRASINLGNPVLAHGTSDDPRGVTVEIARAVADALGVDVTFRCFDAARHSFELVANGAADLGFLAVDPDRADRVSFTEPYTGIEGVYVVPAGSPIAATQDVDRAGTRVGVKRGSAYDLHLSRTLQRAEIVRGDEGVDVFRADGLEVGAGIRQPVEQFAATHDGYRVLDEPFMQIRQAVAVPRDRPAAVITFIEKVLDAKRVDGSIEKWLAATP